MILTEMLKGNAKKIPHVPALTMRMGFRTITLTYKEVYDTARKIAVLLEREGIKKGDSVLLLAPNSPYWICVFWGCILAGAVIVPLNVQSTPEMIGKIAEQTSAKLFFSHCFYRYDSPGNIKRYNLDVIQDTIALLNPESFIPVDLDEKDLVEILYTSGTTGDPKGVMLTHANLFASLLAATKMNSFAYCAERILSILPLSHIFEQAAGFLLAYHYGAHVIFAYSHAAVGRLLKKYKITKMIAVPEFLKIMMNKIEGKVREKGKEKIFNKLLDLSLQLGSKRISRILFRRVHKQFGGKLDTIVSAGAPLDEALEKKWNGLGIVLFQGYGLTETAPLVTSNTYEDHKFGSVGKIAPGVTVRITDNGEIEVKGPNVFSGYYKNEEKTREAFTDDGYFKTGDIGEFDEEGFLFIKGRKKYMILGPGGQNIFPEDIEEILNEFDSVNDSCVVGVTRPNGMVEIHAVLLFDGIAADDDSQKIIAQANAKLASYQQIGGHTIWPEGDFPRTATRKVKKNIVLDFLAQQQKETTESAIEKRGPLVALLSEITGIEQAKITDKTMLQDLQVDSLMRIEILARIEERFGVELDETEIVAQTTVDDLETMIREKKPVKTLPPLRRWPRWLITRIIRSALQAVLFLIVKIFVRLRVKGLEHLEKIDFPVVFMPNHVSYLDGFVVIAALPRRVRRRLAFAAANDMLYRHYWYLVKPAELLFNTFPFPRKEKENIRLGLEYMGRQLDTKFSVVVFPEGAMSVDAKLLPLKKGAGLIGVEMGEYVIPVKIEGSEIVLPYAKVIPRRRATVTVTFGKPIRFARDTSYDDATKKIEEAMRGM